MANKENVKELIAFGNNADLLHPSKYLKAADLRGKTVTVTIEQIIPREELKMRGGKSEFKPILKLKGKDKLLVLNKTNCQAIAKLYGKELTAWLDKSIALYPTRVQCGAQEVDAVRVKAPNGHAEEPAHDPETGEVEATGTTDAAMTYDNAEPGSKG